MVADHKVDDDADDGGGGGDASESPVLSVSC